MRCLLTGLVLASTALVGAGPPNLLTAIRNGDEALVQQLLRAGADVNTADGDGTTPLMHAVIEADVNMMKLLIERGWLHPGSVLMADNVKFPGAPEYRAFMRENAGTWRTTEYETHAEYQTLLKDLVLESEYLGAPAG